MNIFHSSFFEFRPLNTDQGTLVAMTRQRLTDEENLEQLDSDFATLTDKLQLRQIILDLGTVEFMTSAAIGKLISLHRRLKREEGRLVLCSLQPEVQGTLGTSHLLDYFTIAESSEAATSQLT